MKEQQTPITRSKVFLNKTELRPSSARKPTTKKAKRRAVTWKKFYSPQNMMIVQSWARKGWTNDDIAKEIGIALSTFYEWQEKHAEFSEALAESRAYCIAVVEGAVFEKAKGIRTTTTSITRTTTDITKDGEKVGEKTTTVESINEVYIPPDINAAKFYLTNRNGSEWAQTQKTEMTGNVQVSTDTSAADILKRAIAQSAKAAMNTGDTPTERTDEP